VKAWAGTGGEKPSGDLPKGLIARRQARDKTIEEIGAAKVACKALSAELDAAKAALSEAERGASESAASVMSEEAEQRVTGPAGGLAAGKSAPWSWRGLVTNRGESGTKAGPAIAEGARGPERTRAAVSGANATGDQAGGSVAGVSHCSADRSRCDVGGSLVSVPRHPSRRTS